MHICSVITSFTSGGAETLVSKLASQFVKAGHKVSVIALSDARDVGNSPEFEQGFITQLRAQGVATRSLSLGWRRPLFAGGKAIKDALRAIDPDVIHLHTARAVLMTGLARPTAPVILTHHNSRLSFPARMFTIFDRIVFAYVGISDACTRQTRAYARKPARMILNGADASFRAAAPRSGLGKTVTLLAVGALSEQKDYPTLVAAAERLSDGMLADGRSIRLRIVGGGEMMPELAALVNANDARAHIELLGVRSDVPDLMRSADIFVNSSQYEGLSVAMIEAMMAALPVVATDVPGNCELVHHGRNGLLPAAGDPQAFASQVQDLIRTPGLYGRLSQGALESSEALTMENCAASHLQLYEEATAFKIARKEAA